MFISTPRFHLRNFDAADRAAFVAYQMDPRYLRLYDFPADDVQRAHDLFSLFLDWQREAPRTRFQAGIFDPDSGALYGCAGLRLAAAWTAVLGIELAPAHWGRFRLALDVASALLVYGFGTLDLHSISGDTASGNTRIAKLAGWFGAKITDRRDGPDWMKARGWQEVDWILTRADWLRSRAAPC